LHESSQTLNADGRVVVIVWPRFVACDSQGQEITGEIRISPNRQNKRHLDYRLRYAFNGEAVNGVAGVDHKATHYYGMR
jgi:hypothetical protein